MADLDDLYAQRKAQAATLAAREAEARAAATRLERLRAQRHDVARRTDPRAGVTPPLQQLDDDIAEADNTLGVARAAVVQERNDLAQLVQNFGLLADPTTQLGQLDPDVPLLLMPVRLETRFKGNELWVRVYPDDWAVDTFEEQLAEVEIASLQRFWSGMWRAGGDEAMRRAAWRGLVASHGVGRAGWISQQHEPLNPGDEPVRTGADDVILVVVGDKPLATAAQRTAAAAYWEAVWRNVDSAVALKQARAALDAAVGQTTARAIASRPPVNLDDPAPPGVARSAAVVDVALCDLPVVATDATKGSSWTQAPRAGVLPDRFVLLGYIGNSEVVRRVGNPIPDSLVVGPNPSAPPDEQFRLDNGELVIPDELRWMVDFDEALAVGMGFKVTLTAQQATVGFTRLFVLGVRLAASADESQAALETLLTHHHHSRSGLSLLPQGTPTNNTEDQAAGNGADIGGSSAGFGGEDGADAAYDVWFGAGPQLVDQPQVERKQDGQWLAEYLGIDPRVLATVPGAAGTDQAESRAMNVALWPATWGSFLDTMLHPVLDGPDIDAARLFAIHAVSGRGLVPALRIGRQPYGILPTTALAHLGFGGGAQAPRPSPEDPSLGPFLSRLDDLLTQIAADWTPLTEGAPHVGSGAEPHQTLLDIVGQHPASVEFHQRYGESEIDLYNRLLLQVGMNFIQQMDLMGWVDDNRQLLTHLGAPADADPDIIHMLFHGKAHNLKGPVVDDRPLSEDTPVRAYTDDGRNYLRWLADAAGSSLEAVRSQKGFTKNQVPTALLYLLLRHAVLLSWWETALRFRASVGDLTPDGYKLAHRESPYIHVANVPGSESRWQTLYSPAVQLTGDPDRLLVEAIPALIDQAPARHLQAVVSAVQQLVDVPTARLERLLAEHVDCASYRLDAWRLGLVHLRLLTLRLGPTGALGGARTLRKGIQLGAYGWLERVVPEGKVLTPVTLPPDLVPAFGGATQPPLQRDPGNGGFVHAPSLDHAATAAILRSGFMANATPDHPDTMALNISSERVRLALTVIQGVRRGQSLGSLLGYRLERGLHDRHGMAEVDRFIHALRAVFPSPADRDGSQVVDALDLLQQVEKSGTASYPFGHPDLPAPTDAEAEAINAEVERLRDVHDAVADLALAEGVHQAVSGNFDRVAATLDAYGRGGFPPDPGVIETPRRGRALTQRVGVHLRPGLSHTTSPVPGLPMTPRAIADPGVNELLSVLLPAPGDVAIATSWTGPDGVPHDRVVTQAELGLQPVDLLHLLRLEDGAALGELDERAQRHVASSEGLRPDVVPEVHVTDRIAGKVSVFEVAPLVGQLRSALTRARPLRATDVMLPNEARRADDAAAGQAHRARPAAVLAALEAHRDAAVDLVDELDVLLADPVAHRAQLIAGCDDFADRTIDLLRVAGAFGVGGSGWGEISERRRAAFADVLGRVAEVVGRWERRLAEADCRLAQEAALPVTATAEERNRLLILAERAVRSSVTDPLPADPDSYRSAVIVHRGEFVDRLAGLAAVEPGAVDLTGVLGAVAALLPLTVFDAAGLDLAGVEDQAIDLCRYGRQRAASSRAEAHRRVVAAEQHLDDHDAAPVGPAQVAAIEAAIHTLLGADVLVVPEFVLNPVQADEWDAAMAWSRTGGLTAHLAGRPYPVDDWLHGVARVRDKVRCWEQATMLAGVLGRPEPDLRPIQLPHANEPWLALELPPTGVSPGDRLLYTAHYPVAFDRAAAQCGLLLDEWVETIPEDAVTTGVAFHYDRPDSEPPQAMLLATTPAPGRAWSWDDLVTSLHDTLALARLRAVEPDQVAATPYSGLLPATVMSATIRGISISTNLGHNNSMMSYMGDFDV